MIIKRNSSCSGFSLAEILITVAILGILSTIAVNVSVSEADRAKVNTAQIALAGWLQLVQRSALLQKSLQTNQGGCTVNFTSAFANQGNGTQIASVSPARLCSQLKYFTRHTKSWKLKSVGFLHCSIHYLYAKGHNILRRRESDHRN